jgi:hypothetical protein
MRRGPEVQKRGRRTEVVVGLDSNLNPSPTVGIGWIMGDQNLDGLVSGDDYAVVDSNINNGVDNPL